MLDLCRKMRKLGLKHMPAAPEGWFQAPNGRRDGRTLCVSAENFVSGGFEHHLFFALILGQVSLLLVG